MKPTKKYYYKALMGLGILRRGDYRERLLNFYEVFGVFNPDGNKITVWTPDEIATVIGMPDGDGVPKGRRLSALRAKLTRQIGPDGKVIKDGPLTRIMINGLYSWQAVGVHGLPDDALKVLNKKAPPGLVWCRRSQAATLMAKERIDDLPHIYLWTLKESGVTWHGDVPELIDFTDPDVWDFWIHKAPNAVSGPNHALRGIEDRDLRIQVALTGLDAGVKRNLDKNPEWSPGDPLAWALHALSKLVGQEGDWRVMDSKTVKDWRTELMDQNAKIQIPTLKDEAQGDLAYMEKEDEEDDKEDEGVPESPDSAEIETSVGSHGRDEEGGANETGENEALKGETKTPTKPTMEFNFGCPETFTPNLNTFDRSGDADMSLDDLM